jgi:hypothetical protein
MANLKISQLINRNLPSVDSDLIPIVPTGSLITNKITIGNLLSSYTGSMIVSGAATASLAQTASYIQGVIIQTFDSASSTISDTFINVPGYAYNGLRFLKNYNNDVAKTISNNAFSICQSLINVSIPNVTYIGDNAFNFCSSLQSISFQSVEVINSFTFGNCTSLVSASLPNIKTIGVNAFSGNTSLEHVYIPSLSGSTALGGNTANSNVFVNAPNTGYITIPSFYSSSNAGAPDGDLVYLTTSPRSWTINYI